MNSLASRGAFHLTYAVKRSSGFAKIWAKQDSPKPFSCCSTTEAKGCGEKSKGLRRVPAEKKSIISLIRLQLLVF